MDRRSFSHIFASMAVACGIGLCAAPFDAAFAQTASTFPTRPVRIIPFGAPGGPTDLIARVYAEKLQARFGQPIIVDTKPGASGILAADAVAKSAPDGYTILITLPLTQINNAILQPKLPYDPQKDFEALTELATGGPMLVTRADAPYNNVAEFITYAQAHPGLTYGTWGTGSSAHLYGELLKRQSKLDLVHVPYKTESTAHNDMFGGQLGFAWANPATARMLLQAGKIKVLAITGSRRASSMPQVQTFTEQGYAGLDLDSWLGAFAPAKTPKDVVDKWATALREITKLPDVQARLLAAGFEPLGNSPAEFSAQVKADFPRVAELIKAAGVTAD